MFLNVIIVESNIKVLRKKNNNNNTTKKSKRRKQLHTVRNSFGLTIPL